MNDGICYPPVKPTKPVKQSGRPMLIADQSTGYPAMCYLAGPDQPQQNSNVRYVKYVPVGHVNSHSVAVGYILWFFLGFIGAHRFYFGRPISGLIWFLTFGVFGIGWLVDLFLIPSMHHEADSRYSLGSVDYNVTWVFFAFLGWFGIHRFYQGKIFTGLVYLFTGGLLGIGMVYDAFTLNEQISDQNQGRQVYAY